MPEYRYPFLQPLQPGIDRFDSVNRRRFPNWFYDNHPAVNQDRKRNSPFPRVLRLRSQNQLLSARDRGFVDVVPCVEARGVLQHLARWIANRRRVAIFIASRQSASQSPVSWDNCEIIPRWPASRRCQFRFGNLRGIRGRPLRAPRANHRQGIARESPGRPPRPVEVSEFV